MKVFISWSGSTSLAIAKALHDWLPFVFHNIEPWMSTDIDKGRRWYVEMSRELEGDFGLICLTPDNLQAPWIHFEAGALAKSLSEAYVVPLLFQVSVDDLPEPLRHFQAVRKLHSQDEIRDLMKTINNAMVRGGEKRLPENVLEETFENFWPKLQNSLNKIVAETKETQRALESKPVTLSEVWTISNTTANKVDELNRVMASLREANLKYLNLWEQDAQQLAQRLDKNPEAAYIYHASRFGVGHVDAVFTCEINADGSANVRRTIEVEAFIRTLSLLDAYLVLATDDPDQPRDASLAIDKLMLTGVKATDSRISLKVQNTSSRYQSAVNLTFTPPLRPGERTSYTLTETGTGPVFLLNNPMSQASLTDRFTEVFGWSVDRPTKRLELRVVLPRSYEPTVYFAEVRRVSSSGFLGAPLQEYETIRINRPSMSGPDEQDRRTLSMVVDYPMTGLVYTMRWEPIDQ